MEKEDIVIKNRVWEDSFEIIFPIRRDKRQKEEISSAIFFFYPWRRDGLESVETYDRICSMLSKSVDKTIISVEYRLAPEYPFPAGLEDCYLAARALYQGKIFPKIEPGQISVMGDSSGGNLAAALCLLARDRGGIFNS